LVIGLLAAGCSDGDSKAAPDTARTERTTTTGPTTTTAPEREPSTTTTAFDPATVEGAVEAAYLKSWDVYADAVYNLELDESALAAVFAGDHLETKRNEIRRRIAEGRAALVRVDHDYSINVVDASTALVIDRYQNHQVLIDPLTKRPTEADPDEEVDDLVTLSVISGTWKVSLKERAN
jgi:hypothetical protein